jgi:putative DNA primase/helicase
MTDDINDTLQTKGIDAVRARHDKAHDKTAHRQRGGDGSTYRRVLPSPKDPMAVARVFIEESAVDNDPSKPIFRYWRGGWHVWKGAFWQEVSDKHMRSLLYRFCEHACYEVATAKGVVRVLWAPNRVSITNLLEALCAVVILADTISQPCWLEGGRECGTIVACTNGLLDIERRQLLAHSPLFFNLVSVPFPYDPNVPPPTQWLAFLDKLWPRQQEAIARPEIAALGEWFGYVISGRLNLHKILMTVGPTRGGKGIIARIEGALIGEPNVAGPTLSSLSGEFGLAPLLGKSLAVLSDTRSGKHNSAVVVERLLSISGEDTLTVNRKFRDQWTGKLPCRLHIVSNELPRFDDASSAVVGRVVMLMLTESWLGREDHALEDKLRTELSGILNWALAGLYRLTVTNKNKFTRVAAADDAIQQMRDLASPVRAYVRENCELHSGFEISVDHLFGDYKMWSENNNYPKQSKQLFGRDLLAAFSQVKRKHAGSEGNRTRMYVGIRLASP